MDVKSKEYAPFVVTVERGKIKEFSRARKWSPDGRP
jgi:hypothetical protein